MIEMARVFDSMVGVALGLFLCVARIMGRRRTDIPRGILNLVALLGAFGICWGVLGLTSFYCSAQLAKRVVALLNHYRTLCGGIAIGLFLAWCISGQVKPFFNKRFNA